MEKQEELVTEEETPVQREEDENLFLKLVKQRVQRNMNKLQPPSPLPPYRDPKENAFKIHWFDILKFLLLGYGAFRLTWDLKNLLIGLFQNLLTDEKSSVGSSSSAPDPQ